MSLTTLLVANRGEIACRVIRTAKALGLRTVAVYSDADAGAPHVQLADEAIHIGPSPVGESYLSIERILDAAKTTGADCVHPGYGFLSENAAFAEACAKAGLTFIGPPVTAIEVMGDKARAKRAMIEAGVPCVPGYQGEDQDDATLVKAAKEIGLPVMVKAAAGGGGRGMRLVHKAKDLPAAIKLARSEAENAFGSGVLIIEKAILEPRHVEIQIFADMHGNVIHLGERDCSVQRRHQKIIEEAPCPIMTPELRAEMGAAAVEAARAVDYVGAGTVEFLLGADGAFYFLEMNTRLQVEHPVTEEITGLDLVALQIGVAKGDRLPLTQGDVRLDGHAIEVRLYAEDPANDFLPSTGHVTLWHPPTGDTIRVDDGIETGSDISPFYDAMVAKLIARGANRDEALGRLISALKGTALFGVPNNRDFLIDALGQDRFRKGEATTAFISEAYGETGYAPADISTELVAAAAIIDFKLQRDQSTAETVSMNDALLGWSSIRDLQSFFDYAIGDHVHTAEIEQAGPDAFRLRIGDETVDATLLEWGPHEARLRLNGRTVQLIFADTPKELHLAMGDRSATFMKLNTLDLGAGAASGGGTVVAPMHGKILEIAVAEGDTVSTGDRLAVLEAMKMQHEITAEIDGTVATLATAVGTQIAADDLILEITPEGGDNT